MARQVAREEGKYLDEKQYMMYEILTCTFLLGLLLTCGDGDGNTAIQLCLAGALNSDTHSELTALIESLKSRGAREQLLMFATGFAGAGKSTAIKIAQRFCFEFCRAANIMWNDDTFLFTAYTGSAAAAFGGRTTVKSTYYRKKHITDEMRLALLQVRILIIDEVSFMKASELRKLECTLREKNGDRTKPFGGFNIVFCGDFQQLRPVSVPDDEILWHPAAGGFFEKFINCAIVLDGMHRFSDDIGYGHILKRLCEGSLTQEDIDVLNSRVLGANGVKLPKSLPGDTCYATPTNKERNSISAGMFDQHVRETHPRILRSELPPKHTLIIEADMTTSGRYGTRKGISRSMRNRILELGDDDVRFDRTKPVDPCLKCYSGGFYMCMDNDRLEKDGTGNGTQGRLKKIKLKSNAKSLRWKNWDGRKVWTVCASEVEWVEFEHHPKTAEILVLENELNRLSNDDPKKSHLDKMLKRAVQSKTFRLAPKKFTNCTARVSPHDQVGVKQEMKCNMTQIPVNSSDAITGHKLQGLTKDNLIVYSWNKLTEWIYVVLSRVKTLNGLYLVRRLKLSDIKLPSREYLFFLGRMKDMQSGDLKRFETYNTHQDDGELV